MLTRPLSQVDSTWLWPAALLVDLLLGVGARPKGELHMGFAVGWTPNVDRLVRDNPNSGCSRPLKILYMVWGRPLYQVLSVTHMDFGFSI